jgi:environmental stress-induced protein Ves
VKVAHLTGERFVRQPWRNGAGFTLQLAAWGEAQRWLWRLSAAEVPHSGPFSDFAGYDRTILLLNGCGMELRVGHAAPVRIDRPYEPFSFDGGAATHCRLLAGPVKDLNLMVRRDAARGRLDVRTVKRPVWGSIAERWALIHPLHGSVEVRIGGDSHRVAARELLQVEDARGARIGIVPVDPGALVADIRIQPRIPSDER